MFVFLIQSYFASHDALLCISSGTYIDEQNRKKSILDYKFKSTKEMIELFYDLPEAIENTIFIAQRCSFMPYSSDPMLPHFPCKSGDSANEITQLSNQGLNKRLEYVFKLNNHTIKEQKEIKRKYKERLEFELSVINSMKYSGYFLIVSDFIKWSKNNNIPVGPGRGSGAGSVVAWALDIIDVDPLRFGLLFERFLNPERVSMPDFDIDFCQYQRDKVIEYVQNKYGYVAQIITFGKLQARAVLRDVGRVLQMPYNQVNALCKMIPHNPAKPISLQEAININNSLQEEINVNKDVKKLMDISLKLEGLPRHTSTHAAGIVISDVEFENILPLYYDTSSDMPITQFSMKYAEKSGLVKFDFLGLKTLTIIDQVCLLIKESSGREVLINKISLDDKKTYKMLSNGDSIGIFQLERVMMQNALRKLQPDRIEDIIVLISLNRPGPMENIPTYINRKHGIEEPDYFHPILEPALKETYGVVVYQEQVMEVARCMAGYSLGEADLLRRAMGKKIKEEMDKQRDKFVDGAIRNNIDKKQASNIFELIAKFAGYGFNKSHAAAYAIISYQTAYLKANYPVQFYCALLNLCIADTEKICLFIYEIRQHNIEVLPPDINYSEVMFSVENRKIRYGLLALKKVGINALTAIIEERKKNSLFCNINDFLSRTAKYLNKKILETLISSTALKKIHNNSKELYQSIDLILKQCTTKETDDKSNQINLFNKNSSFEFILNNINESWNVFEKYKYEFDAFGFYLIENPINLYEIIFDECNIIPLAQMHKIDQNRSCKIIGVVIKVMFRSSQRGRFVILYIADRTSVLEVNIYNEEVIDENMDILVDRSLLKMSVNVQYDNENGIRISVNKIELLNNTTFQILVHITANLDKNKNIFKELSKILQVQEYGNTTIDLSLHYTLRNNIFADTMVKFCKATKENSNVINYNPKEDIPELFIFDKKVKQQILSIEGIKNIEVKIKNKVS